MVCGTIGIQYVVLRVRIIFINVYVLNARVAQGWSTTLPRWGPRVRIPSRALILKKISKKLLTNENSYDTISELLLKKLATTNLDN